MHGVRDARLKERLRPAHDNFICTIPELTFHHYALVPHHNIYISAKEFINEIQIAL